MKSAEYIIFTDEEMQEITFCAEQAIQGRHCAINNIDAYSPYEQSVLTEVISLKMQQLMAQQYSPKTHFAKVKWNGVYKGINDAHWKVLPTWISKRLK